MPTTKVGHDLMVSVFTGSLQTLSFIWIHDCREGKHKEQQKMSALQRSVAGAKAMAAWSHASYDATKRPAGYKCTHAHVGIVAITVTKYLIAKTDDRCSCMQVLTSTAQVKIWALADCDIGERYLRSVSRGGCMPATLIQLLDTKRCACELLPPRAPGRALDVAHAAMQFSTWSTCTNHVALGPRALLSHVITEYRQQKIGFHRHSRWLYIQQQSSSSSSNRFIEHDVSTRKLGPSSVVFNKTIAGRRRTLLLKDRLSF